MLFVSIIRKGCFGMNIWLGLFNLRICSPNPSPTQLWSATWGLSILETIKIHYTLHFWQFMFKPDSHLVLFASEGGQGPRRSSGALHSIFGALQWHFLLTAKCRGAFQHSLSTLSFVCLFRLSLSFTPWPLSIYGGVLWGREYDVTSYANIVLILTWRHVDNVSQTNGDY